MQRWTLFWVFAAAQTAIALWGLIAGTSDDETARLLVRWTIRASAIPFLMAFWASAIGTLWPGRAAEWLLDNRKYLGLAFAYGIALNTMAIVWLASFDLGVVWSRQSVLDRVESYGGLALVVALTVTSFERFSTRLSAGTWRLLHVVGMYGLWWIFFRTNALYSLSAMQRGLPPERWLNLLITSLLIGTLLLRAAAVIRRLRGGATTTPPREPAMGR